MVKVYDDVWTHSFRPIRSDALMDKSFEVCLRSGMPQWDPWYRLGRAEGRNGVQSFNTGSQ